MTESAKFTKYAGDPVAQSTEDPAMQLVGTFVPDWVTLPAELGGGRRTVQGHAVVRCPCGQRHAVQELDLGANLFVAECSFKGFLWYRRQPQEENG